VKIGPYVEIQSNASVGDDSTISSHSFICSGVSIGSETFVGHGVMFINDDFSLDMDEWVKQRASGSLPILKTTVGNNVRIGSNATILAINIGDGAIIGAGAVVTKNVPAGYVAYGNPAIMKPIR